MDNKAEKVLLELYEMLTDKLEENTQEKIADEKANGHSDRGYGIIDNQLQGILYFLKERVDFKTVVVMKIKEK